MRFIALFAASAALFASTAMVIAKDKTGTPVREGTYFGSGEGDLTVNLRHIENDVYAIGIETIVPIENDMPGCAGGIEGEMILSATGGNFFVENEDYVSGSDNRLMNERYCEVELVFDADGFLVINEKDGCLAYHGAACGFSGTLVHESAAG